MSISSLSQVFLLFKAALDAEVASFFYLLLSNAQFFVVLYISLLYCLFEYFSDQPVWPDVISAFGYLACCCPPIRFVVSECDNNLNAGKPWPQ